MKLENQVCSLDLARQLKNVGMKQESLWMWVKYEFWKEPKLWLSDMNSQLKTTCLSGKREYEYSTPTVAELGERLPIGYETYRRNNYLKNKIEWCCGKMADHTEYADTEANARAKMWLYLKKEKK